MKLRGKPKLAIGLLVGGTLVLLGGGAVAATLPAPSGMMRMVGMEHAHPTQVSTPARSASSTGTAPRLSDSEPPIVTAPSASAAAVPPAQSVPPATTAPAQSALTYVVQPGDTLTAIAAWFKLHGYGDLYAANASVIGADPNLIRPGEKITISGAGVMTVQPPA